MSAQTATGTDVQDRMLGALEGTIEPVRTDVRYRVATLVVAIVLVLLPLVYLSIIGLVGYGVYYHATEHADMLQYGRGRGKILVFLVYVAPMVIGAILVLFMFKPLLVRRRTHEETRVLDPAREPLLFEFVARLCRAVGAPAPRRIQIDAQINASASFRRGWLSLLGRDLTLTIGMPLVAGLELRQLAGVLAHEFGHFAQGAGMRLTYVIRSISHWFTRVVYERDDWDEWLARTASTADLRVGWMLHLARVFVWLTRRVLWVLMMIGHGVSGVLLRQMEFDADRHEARLAGSDTFESTVRRLIELELASGKAHADLGALYREKRLVDDFPRLVVATAEDLPPQAREYVGKIIDESGTGWFDTHPDHRARIESARRERAPGRFAFEGPATLLFRDFADESRRVTWEYYRSMIGTSLRHEDLVPVEHVLAGRAERRAGEEALDRYLQGAFAPFRAIPLFPLEAQARSDVPSLVRHVQRTRQDVVDGAAAYREALEADRDGGDDDRVTAFEVAAGRRLRGAFELLGTEDVARRVEGAADRRIEADRLFAVLDGIGASGPLCDLRDRVEDLARALESFEARSGDEAYLADVERLAQRLVERFKAYLGPLAGIAYPFEGAREGLTLAGYLADEVPEWNRLSDLLHAAGSAVQACIELRARVLGRLCRIAEEVESAIGLPPLPEPTATAAQPPSGEAGSA